MFIAPSSVSLEKSAFKAPKSQELVQFRKSIETGNIMVVKQTFSDNPRYLISSGDTPSILKEGTRYNAIHVTALHNKPKVCELILESVSNPYFIQRLNGRENLKTCQDIANILLDLYLNMPEKGRSDTPLHLAVKYGAIDVVKVLTSYPQCKMTYNLDGLQPKDVVCSRKNDSPKQLIDEISAMLDERFYVPVIRSVDSSLPPTIGEPFTPQNPPNLRVDPLSPEMEIQAYAGPMDKEQAQVFRKRWKTPPRLNLSSPTGNRSSLNGTSLLSNSSFSSPIKPINLSLKLEYSSTPIAQKARRLFPNKSLECHLDEDVKIIEDPLDENGLPVAECDANERFVDYRVKLESIGSSVDDDSTILNSTSYSMNSLLLSDSFEINGSPSFKERHVKLSDTEKGLEVIGRSLAREHNVGWKEYWQFLGTFVDFRSPEGLEQLETYLRNRANHIQAGIEAVSRANELDLSQLCAALQDINISSGKQLAERAQKSLVSRLNDEFQTVMSSPKTVKVYRCVEKSCQIFAQRITKTFTNNNEIVLKVIVERLDKELKRLRSLAFSYTSDFRFWNVNFKYVHARFANLVVAYLKRERYDTETMAKIRECLEGIEGKTTDPDIKCVSVKFRESFANIDAIEEPEMIIEESSCEDAWTSGTPCWCDFHKDPLKNSLKRHKRNKSNEFNRKLQLAAEAAAAIAESTNLVEGYSEEGDGDIWGMRNQKARYFEEDEDIFFTGDENSSDDEFFTPLQSPSEHADGLEKTTLSDEGVDSMKCFDNFILG